MILYCFNENAAWKADFCHCKGFWQLRHVVSTAWIIFARLFSIRGLSRSGTDAETLNCYLLFACTTFVDANLSFPSFSFVPQFGWNGLNLHCIEIWSTIFETNYTINITVRDKSPGYHSLRKKILYAFSKILKILSTLRKIAENSAVFKKSCRVSNDKAGRRG